jgi:hypothetical protein
VSPCILSSLVVIACLTIDNTIHSTGAESMSTEAKIVKKADVASPEDETFLYFAEKAVRDFIREHGRCPRQWADLDITYAYPAFHVTDPDIRPLPKHGNSWRPRGSNYTYLLEVAVDGKTCSIFSVNNEGRRGSYIQLDMDAPASIE